MRHHVRRLCTSALSLLCAGTLVSAQGHANIDTRLRVVDGKSNAILSQTNVIIRNSDGEIVSPDVAPNGELTILTHNRKLHVETTLKGFKPESYAIVLEDAPRVYVIITVDPNTGRVLEVHQKPVTLENRAGHGKIRRTPSGEFGLQGGAGFDDCGTAQSVNCGSSTMFNNAGGTTDAGDPAYSCRFGGAGQGFGTSWFTFTATGTSATIDTNGSATGDTMLAVYSGTCGALTEIACDDDSGDGLLSLVNVAGLTAGQTYYIQVAGFGAGNVGNNTLNVSCAGGGGGGDSDDCATAPSVDCNSSTMFNSAAYVTDASDPAFSCRFGGAGQGFGTAWFTFTATSTSAVIDTNGSATGDTMLAVYSGTCGSLTEIACDDDSGTGLLSLVNVGGLTVGQTYYIQVAGFGAANVGDTTLNVSCASGPAQGDACADAIDTSCGSSATVDNTLFSTDVDDPAFSCRFGGAGQGVGSAWFKFVATDTSARIDTNASLAFDTLLAVYSGTCGSFTELACDDDTGVGLLSEFCVEGLTVGETYYIQAASFSAFDTGEITVTVQCPCPAPPSNDECENAIALGAPPFSVGFDTSLATDDIGLPCGVVSGPFNNVWHTVTGTGGTITLTTCNAGTTHPDTKISVFCGECLEPICVTGNDDNCAGFDSFFSTVSFCSQPGVQYLVTTGGFAAGQVGFVQLDGSSSGSMCTPTVECLPVGACCLADGSCVDATFDDCTAQGGSYQGDGTDCFSNAVVDGGFEGGAFGGNWAESSTNFGTPLCDAGCGLGGGTGPNNGNWWSWFGGIPAFEDGAVSQAVVIPAGASTLDFYLEIPVSSGNGVDFLEVTIDGNQEYLVLENAGPFVGYTLQQVALGAYADGGVHTIEFHSTITGAGGAFTNFFVDDVAINVQATSCALPTGACCLPDG
ncbi:MAG TPA: hypothetical protein VFM38_15695, partial [Candidatus Limnocylindrales bacterium]|nr:hypothetical protein [Candidatus Limnocylindrales bacterium]